MEATVSFCSTSFANCLLCKNSAAQSSRHRKSSILRPPRTVISTKPPLFHFRSRRIAITRRTPNYVSYLHRPVVAAVEDDQSEPLPSESPSLYEASIDIQLPRRSLLVQFTCDSCGEKTQRLVNRLAYERGTVFVQCAGCLQHHKLVDNLGLVVEYDFREEMNANWSTPDIDER